MMKKANYLLLPAKLKSISLDYKNEPIRNSYFQI